MRFPEDTRSRTGSQATNGCAYAATMILSASGGRNEGCAICVGAACVWNGRTRRMALTPLDCGAGDRLKRLFVSQLVALEQSMAAENKG